MLIFLIVLLICGLVLELFSLHTDAGKVSYDITASVPTAEPDETFEIVTALKNKTVMPLNYVRLVESLPPSLEIKEEGSGVMVRDGKTDDESDVKMTSSVYLMPRQQLERRVCVSIPHRGRYFLRGASVHIGDFLGIREKVAYHPLRREIIILPRRADIPEVTDVLGGFMGDISVNRFILEDPVLILGFREYSGREPMKSISWSQTARSGRMMVKKNDYTVEPNVTVILNVESKADHEAIEKCFSIARTVCESLEDKNIQYGFRTNANTASAIGIWSEIGEGLGHNHLYTILEGLGRATYDVTEPFEWLLEKAIRSTRQGMSYVIITPDADNERLHQIDRLRNMSGGQICILKGEA